MSDFPTDFDSMSWKELAVNLSRYLSSALVSHQTEMSDETMHEALGCCHQVMKRNGVERAAPAEDACAVVDKPVAEVSSKFGDPEAFGERELVALIDIQSLPYGTKLYRLNPH